MGEVKESQWRPIPTALGSGIVANCLTTYLGFIHSSCYPSTYPSVCPLIQPFAHLLSIHIHPFIHISTHLPICPSVHLPTHPLIHSVFTENLLISQALFQALTSNQLTGAHTCFTHPTGIYIPSMTVQTITVGTVMLLSLLPTHGSKELERRVTPKWHHLPSQESRALTGTNHRFLGAAGQDAPTPTLRQQHAQAAS